MLILTINGKRAVIKGGSTFKFTFTNDYYTTEASHTFDVTLPLIGVPENQEIFGGPLHLPYTSKAPYSEIKMPFTLVSELGTITGTARVTSVTEEEAKVQLTQTATALQYLDTAADADEETAGPYIDEMDLGNMVTDYSDRAVPLTAQQVPGAWTGHEQDGEWTEEHNALFNTRLAECWECKDSTWAVPGIWCRIQASSAPGTLLRSSIKVPAAAYIPVQPASDTDTVINDCHINLRCTYSNRREIKYVSTDITEPGCNGYALPQPGLFYVLNRILYLYTGARVYYSWNVRDSWIWRASIVTGRKSYLYKDHLPHWRLGYFLRQLRLLFGLRVEISADNHAAVYLAPAGSGHGAGGETDTTGIVSLNQVTDGLSAEIESEEDTEQRDLSRANRAYSFPDTNDVATLPADVWKYAPVIRCANYDALLAYLLDKGYIGNENKDGSRNLYLDEQTNRVYAYLTDTSTGKLAFTEVDYQPPLILHGDRTDPDVETDMELKIVPAPMAYADWPVYAALTPERSGGVGDLVAAASMWVPVMQSGYDNTVAYSDYSINAAINSDNTDTDDTGATAKARSEKEDFMQICYLPDQIDASEDTDADEFSYFTYTPPQTRQKVVSACAAAFPTDGTGYEWHSSDTKFRFPYIFQAFGIPYIKNPSTGLYGRSPYITNMRDPFRLSNYGTPSVFQISINGNGTRAFAWGTGTATDNTGGAGSSTSGSGTNSATGLTTAQSAARAVIDTGTVHTFKFLDIDFTPDPYSTYIINHKRYVCQKLEVTFDSKGAQPLKTGYFFEVN